MGDEPHGEVDRAFERVGPPVERAPTGRRSWSTLQWVLVSIGAILAVTGLLVVAAIVMLVVGMNQWASNK